jgi:hydroxyacylglutathione hydrolase
MPQPIAIPALSDNYVWLIRADQGSACAIIDPGEAAPVIEAIRREGLEPVAVLITHHHHDHIGGLKEIRAAWPDIPVYGPADEPVDGVTEPLVEGARVELDAVGVDFDVIATPGHTLGHIVYHGGGLLICGDTLFAGGCGRVFEGTNDQMHASIERLAAMRRQTICCCGHEYTLANLEFARAVEPDNKALETRQRECRKLRDEGRPTVPFDLGGELRTNPFMRCHEPTVHQAAEAHAGRGLETPAEVFAVLRDWKNNF